jgi:hypothetical protein
MSSKKTNARLLHDNHFHNNRTSRAQTEERKTN